jgi:serine/threonine protein kinase
VLSRPNDLSSVTLVDFGLAKALTARERAEHVCGTLAYVAPEALLAGTYITFLNSIILKPRLLIGCVCTFDLTAG